MRDFEGQKEINHMKGSIIKRGNSYSGAVYVGRNENGIKKYKWVSVPNRQEVKIKLAELKASVATGNYTTPKGTLGELIERYLNDCAKNLSPRTYEGYQSIFRSGIKPALGQLMLRDLKPDKIQRYYTQKQTTGVSTTTVRHHHMMLHRALDYAVKLQLLSRNPADAATPPPIRHVEMHTLDEDGILTFLDAAMNTPYYALFHTALYTGARRSEILALRWQDLDFVRRKISISRSLHQLDNREIIIKGTKSTRSSRKISLEAETCGVLQQHLNNEKALCNQLKTPFTNDRLIFCKWDGKALLPGSISQAWHRLMHKLGYDGVRFHDARHTHASLLLKTGKHPKYVQERLGHATISTTMDLYSHVTPDMQEEVAQAFADMIHARKISRGLADISYVKS